MEFNETNIQQRLRGYFDHKYKLCNSYIFAWESDYFGISQSGLIYEVEIKISRSDFKADFKKEQKHFRFKNSDKEFIAIPKEEEYENKYVACKEINRHGVEIRSHQSYKNLLGYSKLSYIRNIVPNKFYYCVPDGLISVDEVPDYAGLMYINDKGDIRIAKNCKQLHKNKIASKLKGVLLDKFYYESIKLRNELMQLKSDLNTKDYYLDSLFLAEDELIPQFEQKTLF